MDIRELQVDGYGALHDARLDFGVRGEEGSRIVVVYGPNEAGKSTLLRFVRSMLYGFPSRKEPVERGEPVFGGRHGGRLVLGDKSGREWRIERHAERGGELRLRDESGMERTVVQAEWEKLMLGGLSEKMFRQLFAVSLNELHELRTLQGEELGNFLYHAGMAGGPSIAAARRRIGSELDRLYRPRGSTQEINRLLNRIKEHETAIRQSPDGIQAYQEATEVLARTEAELARTEERLPGLRSETIRLQGALELRGWWLKREALLAEAADLREGLADPSAPLLPETAARLWTDLRTARDESAARLASGRASLEALQQRRDKLVWEERWLASMPELERLEAQREGIAAKREERAELEAERRMLDEAVHGALSSISAEWGEAELSALGGMAADREHIRELRHKLDETERAAAALQVEQRRLDRQMEVLQAEEQALAAELESAPRRTAARASGFVPRTKTDLLQAWHAAEDARREYERSGGGVLGAARPAASRASSRKQPRGAFWGQLALAGIVALAALAWPLLFRGEDGVSVSAFLLSAALLLLSACLAAYGWQKRGRLTLTASSAEPVSAEQRTDWQAARTRVNERLQELIADSEAAAAAAVFAQGPERSGGEPGKPAYASAREVEPDTDAWWRQLREAVHDQIACWEEAERGAARRQEMLGRMQELRKERELIRRDADGLADHLAQLREEWSQWLRERKLPSRLTPQAAPELFVTAERGQAALRQRQRIAERWNALDSAILAFDQAAARLAEAFPLPASLQGDASLAVQWLYREAANQWSAREEAEGLDQTIRVESSAVEIAAEEVDKLLKRIAGMLKEAGVGEESEMDARLLVDERCRALRKEAREIQLRLESGRDMQEQEALYGLLAGRDEAFLTALAAERREELATAEETKSELLDRRGRLAQELERLGREAELKDHNQQLSELRGQLEGLAERYALLAIADRLVVKTKAVYEEEKQPEVLLRASGYFRQMTGGEYLRVAAPGDSKALLAETKDRVWLDSLYLSRGTQEQLYLSMRFALGGAASPDQPLPFLLDDLFVHFDEKRLVQSLPVLEEMGKVRQVVLFTCHRHVADAVLSGIPGARLVRLKDEAAV